MGDISDHFNRSEFHCKCGACERDTIDADTLALLEVIRNHYGRPVIVHSGHRCEAHNKAVGGAVDSQHLYGRAADIEVQGIDPEDVYQLLDPGHEGGLGSYETFTHVDTRNYRARWSG